MSDKSPRTAEVRLPVELEQQLTSYRSLVWTAKIIEAVAIAVSAILLAFLSIFVLDRFADTASSFRFAALTLVVLGCTVIPWGLFHWVWRRRSLPQVARLISQKNPNAGDRLLGVMELVSDPAEQKRSPVLCRAAVEQVAAEAAQWDLAQDALPARRKGWTIAALGLFTLAFGLAMFVPAATQSSWSRLLSPWKDIPRYSFAAFADVPKSIVVAHGEPFVLELALAAGSLWEPASGQVTVGSQKPLEASLGERNYRFHVPAQINASTIAVRIGDARHDIKLLPTLRPELTAVMAHLTLPEYLERPGELEQDVRGGSISLVTGSQVSIRATANRKLQSARVNGLNKEPEQADITTVKMLVDQSREVVFRWTDQQGLTGKEPLKVTITQADDEPPVLSCQGLSRLQVVLVTEQLRFDIQAHDDFGIRKIGMEWNGFSLDGSPSDLQGERTLAAGGAEREVINAAGAFSADNLGIEPQPISLRIYAEDYLPGRKRSYSPSYVLYVLSPDQHAIWLTEQLSKWHRRALEVRDRELQLYETNKQLRALPVERLQLGETRERVQRQAAAERANGRRLSTLNRSGEQLVKQATRNPEFGVGHLEKWAQMLQLLQEISANRMPSVADLLKEASDAPLLAAKAAESKSLPTAGVDRSPKSSATGGQPDEKQPKQPVVPQILVVPQIPVVPQIIIAESSQQPLEQVANDSQPPKSPGGAPSLSLPVTTLMGKAKPGDACPVGDKMDEAIAEQRDLLAEFQRIANELNNILANLEGSSLVKRLKSASRKQNVTAGEIGKLVDSTFGMVDSLASNDKKTLKDLSKKEDASSLTVSYIMDDMQAYFERRPFARFRTVIDQMSEADVVGNLRDLSQEFSENQGLSMAECEFWSDSLDRWAEDLVDPASGGT